MDKSILLAILATAAGTWLMRLLPLIWMQGHLGRLNSEKTVESLPDWLSVMGPAMIAALLGVSLVPATLSLTDWLAPLLGVLLTLLVWYRSRSLGLPVLAGVFAYGLVKLLGNL